MYVIGLTGGIGSGKSTVASILEEQGAVLLSADRIGHDLYQPGRPAWQEIVDAFGREVLAEDGTVDRKKLGAIVFGDRQQMKKLNRITHPRMKGVMREKLAELERKGVQAVVLEAALLFDAGWDDLADEVWVTTVQPEIAGRRTAERSGISEQQALERIKAQMSDEERTRRADVVLHTEGDLEDTRRQTLAHWRRLKKRLAAKA